MRVTRRAFLHLNAAALASSALGACIGTGRGVLPPEVPTVEPPAVPGTAPAAIPTRYQEAPALGEQVARGELPPVAERLPTRPLVLEPNASLGQYGGGLRAAVYTGPACTDLNVELGLLLDDVLATCLVAFGQDLALRPNLAESWEYDESGTQLTFHLRQGVRWSDGAPFTTEDILFFLNYYPQRPPAGDRVVAADDHTIIFRWEQPEPQYLTNFAWSEQHWPAHYLKPYHIAFSEDAFLRLNQQSAKARLGADYDDWVASGGLERIAGSVGAAEEERWAVMFLPLTANRQPGRPVLGPWVVEGEPGCRRIALRRNPYFWQVDPEGRQLPYLDRVVFDGVEDATLFRAALANGEVDLQALGMTAGDLPWLRDHEADGDYRARTLPSTWHLTLHLNLATADELLRPFFNDLRVRQAVMLGIDRERLNFEFYDGLCTARQVSPLEGTRFYDEGISQGYVAYDVDAANALLDEAGYGERDSEGYRMHPNGERVTFEIAGATQGGSAEEACAEEVAGYLRDLGLECAYRRVRADEMSALVTRNAIQAAWMPDYSFPVLPTRAAFTFLGFGINRQPWAEVYGYYWYATTTGVSRYTDLMIEPPAGHWIWELWRIYEEMGEETDIEKWEEGFRRLMRAWAEQVPVIGILGQMPQPVVVHNDLRNYVDGLPYDEQVGGITLQSLQQLYWEHPERHVVEE
jgi:peptide/nickel transport system substrate-binding protein